MDENKLVIIFDDLTKEFILNHLEMRRHKNKKSYFYECSTESFNMTLKLLSKGYI